MGLFGRKKKVKDDSSTEWTSFEFVQFLIKYPDTSDDNFVRMYSNLLGEDNLEKDLEDYWKQRLEESFISQEEFKKIRKLSQAKNETKDIAEWAVTNTEEEDRTIDDKTIDENFKD